MDDWHARRHLRAQFASSLAYLNDLRERQRNIVALGSRRKGKSLIFAFCKNYILFFLDQVLSEVI